MKTTPYEITERPDKTRGGQIMTEELLIQLMNQINDEHIVHGSCEVKFTFHDGRIEFYELTSHKRVNIGKGCTTVKDGINGARKSAWKDTVRYCSRVYSY